MNATDKVILTFGWNGPTSWKGVQMEKVDFLLPELQAKVNVSIPKRLSRGRALPFNSQKGDRQTTPEFLRVLANRLQNLTLQLIMKDGPLELKEEWTLAPLPPLEAEQMYQLTVHASDELQFALSLDPVEQKDLIAKEKQQFCEILADMTNSQKDPEFRERALSYCLSNVHYVETSALRDCLAAIRDLGSYPSKKKLEETIVESLGEELYMDLLYDRLRLPQCSSP